jgi:ABC-2 type transport system permease protein/oleandomycin transport system permease protein
MARSAVLAGRTLSDTVRNLFVVVLMTGVGSLIGFRFHAGFFAAIAAMLLVVFFGFAFTWISANIGLAVRDTESAQTASFIWLFPLVFASSIFVPVQTMPGWLQAIARVNPISSVVNAARVLCLGGPTTNALVHALLWALAITVVFVPLAVRRYRRMT